MVRSLRPFLLPLILGSIGAVAQPCQVGYNFTASVQPINGTYACGQTVTFCYTVTNWNSTNANWFHGIVASFGPGWDMSTLVPGPPPATCGGSGGTWGWYNSVAGTAGTALPAQGPGFFFDLNNDGNPGNNFGDFCTGAVNWQFCWTISVQSGAACVNGLSLGVSANTFGDSETGSWGSSGCTGDANPSVFPGPVVIQNCALDPGIGAMVNLCSNSPVVDLFTQLTGTPNVGGTWTGPGGIAHTGMLDPAVDIPGNYTYTVSTVAPPCSVQSVTAVSINPQPDAGLDGSLTVCASDPAIALFAQLGGTPDAGGTWTDGLGAAHTGTFDPAIDASGLFSYTLNALAPCAPVTATVDVTVNPSPNAGINAAVTVCSSGAASALFALLGGTPALGGTWSDPLGAAHSGLFNPATDPPGPYTYTVPAIAPCLPSAATVNVTVNPQPNAGANGNLTLCSSDVPIALFAQLTGTPDVGGTWTDPLGVAHAGAFDPALDPAGAYTYTLAAVAPCTSVSASVTMGINPAPVAGLNGNTSVCSTGAPVALFGSLGGAPSAGGTWTNTSGAPFSGSYDPATNAPGVFTYTVAGVAPCPNSTATVTVVEQQQPNAGTNALLDVCTAGAAIPLIGALGGTPDATGTWTDPLGAPNGGTLLPGTAISGTYTYTVAGVAPCMNAQAAVDITMVQQPTAGTNAVVNLCEASPVTNLFTLLGGTPTPGGTWTGPSGGAATSTFMPGTSIPGPYTYSVIATAPCANSSATVTVNVAALPDAGTDAVLAVCSSGAPAAMLPLLGAGAQVGGTWSSPSGLPIGGTFTPGTSVDGVYTYSIIGSAPCPDASATVTVTTTAAGNAGTPSAVPLSYCNNGAPVGLFATLGGSPQAGGTWTLPSGASFNGTITPATASSGTYTYSIASNGPCPAVSSASNVTIVPAPNAGSNGMHTLCTSQATPYTLLNALGGSPANTGSWTGPNGQPHGPAFSAGTDPAGVYTYTVTAVAPCVSATSTVDMGLVQAANAGTGGSVALCANAAPIAPFAWLGGTPNPGGTWTGPGGGAVVTVDPATAASGSYTYTVTATAPCPNVQASVALSIAPLPNAGIDVSIELCGNGSPANLLLALGSGAQPGGTWTGPSGSSNGSFIPSVNIPGTYSYTVQGTGACSAVQAHAIATVVVIPIPLPSFTMSADVGCAPLQVQFFNDDPINTYSAVWSFGDGGSSNQTNGSWYTYQGAGRFDVALEVTDANGCVGSISMDGAILVSEGAEALFTATPGRVSVQNPVVTVGHEPEPSVVYTWNFNASETDTSGTFDIRFVPGEVGYHTICLTATDTLGCVNEYCDRVLVDDVLTVFVPNAFTPNGDDRNERFKPSVLGAAEGYYEFMIFDRWGLLVFRTEDPNEGWTGGMDNSETMLPDGVYVWRLKAKDQFSPEREDLIGTVTLLK